MKSSKDIASSKCCRPEFSRQHSAKHSRETFRWIYLQAYLRMMATTKVFPFLCVSELSTEIIDAQYRASIITLDGSSPLGIFREREERTLCAPYRPIERGVLQGCGGEVEVNGREDPKVLKVVGLRTEEVRFFPTSLDLSKCLPNTSSSSSSPPL